VRSLPIRQPVRHPWGGDTRLHNARVLPLFVRLWLVEHEYGEKAEWGEDVADGGRDIYGVDDSAVATLDAVSSDVAVVIRYRST
jgi:hypothetical protein